MVRCLIIFFLFPFFSYAQNLSGTWVGNSGMAYVKLVVIHQGDSLFGYTYDSKPGYCKATFAGKFSVNNQTLKGKGLQMLENSGTHGLANYNLNYSKDHDKEYLHGSVYSSGLLARLLTLGIGSPIRLKKINEKIDSIPFIKAVLARKVDTVVHQKPLPPVKIITKDSTVNSLPILITKQQRISKVVETIYTNVDSLRITVFDNGEVDNDSVTIFFDDKVVLANFRITDKAKEISLPMPKDDKVHSLELFAINLGMIPPNTSLVIIQAGAKRYEIRAAYDLQTNARINILFKE